MSTESNILNTMPAVKIMLQDRTVEVSDIEIARRKGNPIFEVTNGNGTLEWTCRLPVALKAYDKALTATIWRIDRSGNKRKIRSKFNRIEMPI